MSQNRVIGRDGGLPWRLPDDMRRFKNHTIGHVIIMGRKTWDSMGQPLPDRHSVVITRQTDLVLDGADVVNTLDAALAVARDAGETEAFVIGGSAIYEMALPVANRLYLTRIQADVSGDTFFPEFDPDEWVVARAEGHEADARHAFPFIFQTLLRKN